MGSWTVTSMKLVAETLRFALCLAIVIVAGFCALHIASAMQDLNELLADHARNLMEHVR